MKPYSTATISAKSRLDMHKDSHRISKLKPKIRIIHVVAPEIIKTEVENFRDIVQRLTGKRADNMKGSTEYKASRVSSKGLSTNYPKKWRNIQPQQQDQEMPKLLSKKREIHILQTATRMKGIQEMYKGESSHGHFQGFGDIDSFIQDLTECPMLPFKSSQINMFGEMPLCELNTSM